MRLNGLHEGAHTSACSGAEVLPGLPPLIRLRVDVLKKRSLGHVNETMGVRNRSVQCVLACQVLLPTMAVRLVSVLFVSSAVLFIHLFIYSFIYSDPYIFMTKCL